MRHPWGAWSFQHSVYVHSLGMFISYLPYAKIPGILEPTVRWWGEEADAKQVKKQMVPFQTVMNPLGECNVTLPPRTRMLS